MPADKQIAPVEAASALGDRGSMAYSGTFVVAGQGAGVAVATGLRTELGRISRMMSDIEPLETPLLRDLGRLARNLTLIILVISAIAFIVAVWLRGYGYGEAFMIVVGLAVAAVPEGLTAVMTITLAIGVRRMAERHAIIRRLPAVETLGAVSVICTDKTGTLTRNEMTVRSLALAEAECAVTGVGYDPAGEISGAPPQDLLLAALLCNDAELERNASGWRVNGDPMEGALVVLAAKGGLSAADVRARYPRLREIPFDASHRFMATLHGGAARIAFLKGAPEKLIDMCSLQRTAAGDDVVEREEWRRRAERLAAEGQRVLALALKRLPADADGLSFADVDSGATLLGLVGLIDPPRSEALEAVRQCRAAGIRVAMITGDHPVTAREIARQLKLADEPLVLTGNELDAMDETEFRRQAAAASVFARTAPQHKLRLVRAFQEQGAIVAMTGDGVNDAPALRQADVGVAMGIKGTEATKEAAEMVLADDNFASIAAAVREGRTVYDNLRKVVQWTLPTNGGEASLIIVALALGLTLPVTPVQILWINMITAVALGLTLAFEPAEPGVMRRTPRDPRQALLNAELVWKTVFVSALIAAGGFLTFEWAQAQGRSLETARTLVVNAVVVMEIFHLFSVRYVHGTSLTWRGALGTPAVLAGVGAVVLAQFLFTYSWLGRFFDSRPIGLGDGLFVIGVGVALLVLLETEKAVWRALRQSRAASGPDHARLGSGTVPTR